VASSDVVTWHVVVVLSLVAGYAVRFSYRAAASVTEAREALAWRAAAEERRRVARDVHDVVAHTLAVTMLHITAARMAVNRGAPDVAVNALEEAERQGRSSLADIRRIVRLLRAEEGSAIDAVQPGLADV
jgi:signal transduction histidine kinase